MAQVQKQKTATNPLDSGPSEVVQRPLPEKIAVNVSYGANVKDFSIMGEQTMGQVLADKDISTVIGYGDLGASNVMLIANGELVNKDYVVKTGDQLEIIKRAGEKA